MQKIPKIIITMMIKNEEDIIAQNIEHHIDKGVWGFIIADNNSTDKTKEIIERYSEVLEILDIQDEDHPQSKIVTSMARKAVQYNPDWIIHADADELWDGFQNLNYLKNKYCSSCSMFFHPHVKEEAFDKMNYFINLDPIKELPQEAKVFHRPDPDIVITHGNHGFQNISEFESTNKIWRHHYPIRSYQQLVKKATQGHKALLKRNAICDRWKKWHDLESTGELRKLFQYCCFQWEEYIRTQDKEHFINMLSMWCTDEAIDIIKNSNNKPLIGDFYV